MIIRPATMNIDEFGNFLHQEVTSLSEMAKNINEKYYYTWSFEDYNSALIHKLNFNSELQATFYSEEAIQSEKNGMTI